MNALNLLQLAVESDVPLKMTLYGNSMLPFIKSGDIAIVKSVHGEVPNVGDIYAFIQPGSEKLIIHRMVNIYGEICEMKGDNCKNVDGRIPFSALMGKITLVERQGRKIFYRNGLKNKVVAHLSRLNIPYIYQNIIDLLGKVQRRVKQALHAG